MSTMTDLFGTMVFDDKVMEERLPKETYKAMQKTIKDGLPLVDLEVANVVANAMKDWAIEKGATHFTHWFQPMTGITAEKHDSFISPAPDGKVIMDGAPRQVFTQVERLRSMGLTVPDTVDLLDRLRKDGLDVPLTALTVEACADAIYSAVAK
mgnify:CR=1 FL=1